MKLREVNRRYIMNMTRLEALLVQDALYDFQVNRSESQSWDCGFDPILVAQINRVLDKVLLQGYMNT